MCFSPLFLLLSTLATGVECLHAHLRMSTPGTGTEDSILHAGESMLVLPGGAVVVAEPYTGVHHNTAERLAARILGLYR